MSLFTVAAFSTLLKDSFTFFTSLANYRKHYQDEEYDVIEGEIENYIFTPSEEHNKGSAQESFQVSGVIFVYSDKNKDSSYNRTKLYGGEIKNGMRVRIYHVNNNIIGLWILESM
jgi:hypothetical protein